MHFQFNLTTMMWTCRQICVLTALFSIFLNQLITASEEDTKTYLLDRHKLFRRTDIPNLSMNPMEHRSLSNEEIIEFDDSGEFPTGRAKNVRMHSLFGRTIPIVQSRPFAAKIFRIGEHNNQLFKGGRSFNDNSNYRDAMKRILLRMN